MLATLPPPPASLTCQTGEPCHERRPCYTNQRVRELCAGGRPVYANQQCFHRSAGSRALTGSRFSKSLVHDN